MFNSFKKHKTIENVYMLKSLATQDNRVCVYVEKLSNTRQ